MAGVVFCMIDSCSTQESRQAERSLGDSNLPTVSLRLSVTDDYDIARPFVRPTRLPDELIPSATNNIENIPTEHSLSAGQIFLSRSIFYAIKILHPHLRLFMLAVKRSAASRMRFSRLVVIFLLGRRMFMPTSSFADSFLVKN